MPFIPQTHRLDPHSGSRFQAVPQPVGLRPTGWGVMPQTARLTHRTFKAYVEGACEFIDVVYSTFKRWASRELGSHPGARGGRGAAFPMSEALSTGASP